MSDTCLGKQLCLNARSTAISRSADETNRAEYPVTGVQHISIDGKCFFERFLSKCKRNCQQIHIYFDLEPITYM